jgi:hypothetical protein
MGLITDHVNQKTDKTAELIFFVIFARIARL